MHPQLRALAAIVVACSLAACGDRSSPKTDEHGHAEQASEFERGPHRGRMLRDGDFALEITIFETGVEPEFRVYAYRKDKPVDPRRVQLSIELRRLGGKVDQFAFAPVENYLRGSGVVAEPHSFDVTVRATEGGANHRWAYAFYEGRTIISPGAAKSGGMTTEKAGPVTLDERIDMSGRVEIIPEGKAEIRAVFPGRILSMGPELGQQVRKGQALARVESSYSLQAYTIVSPISGMIVEKTASVGGVAGEQPLYVVADPTKLHAEFFVYPRDAERVRAGQTVEVRSLSGDHRLTAKVEAILPTADLVSQTVIAHVHLPDNAAPNFRPGMGVEGSFVVGRQPAPLAVRTRALQSFRDFTVVFAKVGNTYEVRMLTLGRRTPEWTEVLGGLDAGTEYVVDGAFLVRADIEKSGASHDH